MGARGARAVTAEFAYVENILRRADSATALQPVPRVPRGFGAVSVRRPRTSSRGAVLTAPDGTRTHVGGNTFVAAGIDLAPGLVRGTAPLSLVASFNSARNRVLELAKQPPFSRAASRIAMWAREQNRLLGLHMRRGQTGDATGIQTRMQNAAQVMATVAKAYSRAFVAYDFLERSAPKAKIGAVRQKVAQLRMAAAVGTEQVLRGSNGDPVAARQSLMRVAQGAVAKAEQAKQELNAQNIARAVVANNRQRLMI